MRIFHSELASNPAYYGFGYSVYGQLETGDNLADAYAQGLVPFVGAVKQADGMMYMVRSSRVRVQEFKRIHYHHYAAKKAEEFAGRLERTEHERESLKNPEMVQEFMLTYFQYRFGKGAMTSARLAAIFACSLLTHIVEYRLDGAAVGYVLETRGEGFTHLWYYGYAKAYEKKCLGLHLFTEFVETSKARGDTYAYLGSTYGNWMKYKTYYRPLEYWDGEVWVDDAKGTQLKQLLQTDTIRQTAFVDRWRETREPYYPSPFPFASVKAELRFLTLLMYATPRVFAVFLFFCALLAGVLALSTLGG